MANGPKGGGGGGSSDTKKIIAAELAASSVGAAGLVGGAAALAKVLEKLKGVADTLIVPFENMADAGENFAKSMGATSGFPKTIGEMVTKFDELAVGVQRATGQGDKYTSMALSLQGQMGALGASLTETTDSFKTLHENFAEFSQMLPSSQTALAKQVTSFTRLGVSMQSTIKTQDIFIKGLGMTTKEAIKANDRMMKSALALQIPAKQMAKDFATALPELAKYGKGGVVVFDELAIQSKATGIEMSKLLGIAAKFDTFESAAKSAGKLNAILGGNLLNSVEMLTASESQRIDMVRLAMKQSGMQWTSLDRFQKKAVAAQLGIQDMTDATKLFGVEQARLEDLEKKVDPAVLAQQNLTKAMISGTKIAERWNVIFERISMTLGKVFRPILKELSKWISGKEGMAGANQIIGIFVKGLRSIFTWWKKLTPEWKKSIIGFGKMLAKAILFSGVLVAVKKTADPLFTLLSNPLVMAGGAIATIIAHWGRFDVLMKKVRGKIGAVDDAIMNFFETNKKYKSWMDPIKDGYVWLKGIFIPLFKRFSTYMKKEFLGDMKTLGNWFKDNKGPMIEFFKSVRDSARKYLGPIWTQFETSTGMFEGGLLTSIGRWMSKLRVGMGEMTQWLYQAMGMMARGFGAVLSLVPGVPDSVGNMLENFGNLAALRGAGYQISAGEYRKGESARRMAAGEGDYTAGERAKAIRTYQQSTLYDVLRKAGAGRFRGVKIPQVSTGRLLEMLEEDLDPMGEADQMRGPSYYLAQKRRSRDAAYRAQLGRFNDIYNTLARGMKAAKTKSDVPFISGGGGTMGEMIRSGTGYIEKNGRFLPTQQMGAFAGRTRKYLQSILDSPTAGLPKELGGTDLPEFAVGGSFQKGVVHGGEMVFQAQPGIGDAYAMAASQVQGNMMGNNQPQEIVLKVGDIELGRVVMDAINKVNKQNMRLA